jgi:hypothetical protein
MSGEGGFAIPKKSKVDKETKAKTEKRIKLVGCEQLIQKHTLLLGRIQNLPATYTSVLFAAGGDDSCDNSSTTKSQG